MNGRITVLGSGTSFGVPVIGCTCGVCTSEDPRDKRTRVSAVLEFGDGPRILIDTPPEIRLQLVAAGVRSVDAVLYTHDHADHVHGIDDLRAMSVRSGGLPFYAQPHTIESIRRRFEYIFDPTVTLPSGSSKPALTALPVEPWEEKDVLGVPVTTLPFNHGPTEVVGYRLGPVAYVTDAKTVSAQAIDRLRGVEVLVLNALFEEPHASHLSIPEAIEVARAVGAARTVLTHLTHRYGHVALETRLPAGIEPAYDGLTLSF